MPKASSACLPEIIVAIVGVETFYGRNTGRYRVLDALSTLAFDYPRRAAFFRGELRDFLLLTRDLGVSPAAPKGSFAGAIGLPQFMPGSYRNFAIDFDADGRVDLWESTDDVIGSVANFLVRHDWQRGQPVLMPASIAEEKKAEVLRRLDGGISERRALEAWLADGVAPRESPAGLASDPVGLLMLEESDTRGKLLDRRQQLLRAHALQPQPALCRGGVEPRTGDQGRVSRIRQRREVMSACRAACSGRAIHGVKLRRGPVPGRSPSGGPCARSP